MERKGQGLLAQFSRLNLDYKLPDEAVDFLSKQTPRELSLLLYGLANFLNEQELTNEQLLGELLVEATERENAKWKD